MEINHDNYNEKKRRRRRKERNKNSAVGEWEMK